MSSSQGVHLSEVELPQVDSTIPPWPSEFTEVAGPRLHVRRTPGGAAGTVVYVHGLGGSSTNWTDLAALLAPTAAGVAIDLPGFGFSEPDPGFSFSLSAHAAVLTRFVESLDAGPVHLVANSMGGAIALLLAAGNPEQVRSLTLISPAMPDLRPDPRRLSDPRLALAYLPVVGKSVRRQLAALEPRERAAQVIKLCYANPELFPAHRLDELADEHAARAGQQWANAAMSRSIVDIFRTWLTRGSGSLWRVAGEVRAPSLVIWGERDRVVSVRRAVRTARSLPRGKLLVVPGTGHIAQMERPETVARAVLGMWEDVEHGEW